MPGEPGLMFTQQQMDQLANLLPAMMNVNGSYTTEDIDQHFSGIISCFYVADSSEEWTVDYGLWSI